MRLITVVFSVVPLILTGSLWAQAKGVAGDLPALRPREQEIALAESAGLKTWVKQAAIYVLERGGYVKVREGTNGFSCLVLHDRADTQEPICFDPEGTETILPRSLRIAELREQGRSDEEIRQEMAEGYLSGKYRAPRRPGIAYMLSMENRVFNGKKVIWFPPHLMVYAPNATSQDVGADPDLMPHSPFVLFEGSPNAYFVVVVADTMPTEP